MGVNPLLDWPHYSRLLQATLFEELRVFFVTVATLLTEVTFQL